MEWLDQCRALCQDVKYLSEPTDWSERPNHSGWLRADCRLLDQNRTSIPGLNLQCEYRLSHLGHEICGFGLMFRKGMDRYRVFFLEVYPAHVRSHKEPGKEIFGSHIHFGDARQQQITRPVYSGITNALSPQWIERFRRHAKTLNDGTNIISGPFINDIFAQKQ